MKQCIALFGHNHIFSLPVIHKDFYIMAYSFLPLVLSDSKRNVSDLLLLNCQEALTRRNLPPHFFKEKNDRVAT